MVAEVAKFAPEGLAELADRLASPADLATRCWRQAAQHAQQAGLSRAIHALQVEHFAPFKPEADVGEQAAFTAYAFQIGSFKHAGGDPGSGQGRRGRIVNPRV
jgi:hypothetical protein